MTYFVPGYVYIVLSRYFRFHENKADELIIPSIVISYILIIVIEASIGIFKATVSQNILMLISLSLSCILAFVFFRLSKCKWICDLLLKLGIFRTSNPSIWMDVIEPNCKLFAYLDDCIVCGKYKYGEEGTKEPFIVLEKYKVLDKDDPEKIISDFTKDKLKVIMISTKNIKRIEISYRAKTDNKPKSQCQEITPPVTDPKP